MNNEFLRKLMKDVPRIVHDFRESAFTPEWHCVGWHRISDNRGRLTVLDKSNQIVSGDGVVLEWKDEKLVKVFAIQLVTHSPKTNVVSLIVDVVAGLNPSVVDEFLRLRKEST